MVEKELQSKEYKHFARKASLKKTRKNISL